MDAGGYSDWIEGNVENPDMLIGIRVRVAADRELSDVERTELDERIGMYLADLERDGTIELEDEDDEGDAGAGTA